MAYTENGRTVYEDGDFDNLFFWLFFGSVVGFILDFHTNIEDIFLWSVVAFGGLWMASWIARKLM